MSVHAANVIPFGASTLNVLWTFVEYLSSAFLTNTDYRNGFLSAILIGAAVLGSRRVGRTLVARVQAIIAARNQPEEVIEEPSMFTGTVKNAKRAMGLAVAVMILILLF